MSDAYHTEQRNCKADALCLCRSIRIPDVDPSDLPATAQFSMVAGGFLDVYEKRCEWDCVLTCFFIDTAHNILEYVRTISSILKLGGYWINFGIHFYFAMFSFAL